MSKDSNITFIAVVISLVLHLCMLMVNVTDKLILTLQDCMISSFMHFSTCIKPTILITDYDTDIE